ncbi:MAG: hypothetical protein AAFO94_12750 [Bacteroidota bacterium]
MKTKALILISSLMLLLSSSCNNALEDYAYLFFGAWESDKFYIEIYNDGYGYIEKFGLFGFAGEDADVIIHNDRLIFDTPNRTKRFDVEVSPFYDEFIDEVVMVLDGREYYRVD